MSKTVKENQDSTAIKKTDTKSKSVKKSVAKVASKIRVYTNEYDIQMVEISGENRPQFVSLAKVRDVLRTNTVPNIIRPVKFKGRDLFEIDRLQGKPLKMGENKISAILNNSVELEQAVIDAGLVVTEAGA